MSRHTTESALRDAVAITVLACSTSWSAQATEMSTDWKADCVGTMELRIPGEADTAAYLPQQLAKEIREGSLAYVIRFPDDQWAGFGRFWYQGVFKVTHPVTNDQYKEMIGLQEAGRMQVENYVKTHPEKNARGEMEEVSNVPFNYLQGAGWRIGADYDVLSKVGSSAISWTTSSKNPNGDKEAARVFAMIDRAIPRPLYTVPRQPGICLPYVFIPDEDAMPGRAIGMTYRLKEHPDITIWLEDSHAVGIAKGANPLKFTVESKTDFFWGQQYVRQADAMLINLDTKRRLAGYKAFNTFVELRRRDDNSQDYGYLSVVRGDPKAQVDTPDLMFYVIRNAKNATAKGIEPVGKDEFLTMARSIAASVKRRILAMPTEGAPARQVQR